MLDTWFLIDKSQALAFNYCEVLTLSREDMDAVIEHFPESGKIIRKYIIRLAVLRQMIYVSNKLKKKIQNTPEIDPSDFIRALFSDQETKMLFTKDMVTVYNTKPVPSDDIEMIQQL